MLNEIQFTCVAYTFFAVYRLRKSVYQYKNIKKAIENGLHQARTKTPNPRPLLSVVLMKDRVCRRFQFVQAGVPQGSILSPSSLVMSMNGLSFAPNSYRHYNVPPVVSLFADGTSLIFHGSDSNVPPFSLKGHAVFIGLIFC